MVFISTLATTNATTSAAAVLTDDVLLPTAPAPTSFIPTAPTAPAANTNANTNTNPPNCNRAQANATAKTTTNATPSTTTASPPNATDATATADIVSLAEKLRIAEFYASLNETPATASFNALCNNLRLHNPSTASTPVTPLSPPSTPPCTPANPPTSWRPTPERPADHPDVQVANALRGVSYNGVHTTSVAHLLHLRALQNHSLDATHMSPEEKTALYDHHQQHYIQTLHNTRDRIRNAMRAKIRDAIKLGCIKPEALRKRASALRSKSSSHATTKNATIISAASAAAAAASTAAETAPASPTRFTPASTSDLSLEERVHRVFRAHRFLLQESQHVLSQIRIVSESNMSPIMSDDDMDDAPDGPHGVPNVNRANNRTVVDVAM